MAPAPDHHPGQQLLQAALRLLEANGPDAVQARKLAAEVGTSTMAVYTHFGGMAELFEAMVREGFVRFAAHVASVPRSSNPMADFFVQGMAYRQWALANRQLYRLMFGMNDACPPSRAAQDLTVTGAISLPPEGDAAFGVMTDTLERIQQAGQIAAVDTAAAAGQFLAATHGYVLLEMAGYFEPQGQSLATVLGPMAISLMVGLGADRRTVDQSITAALVAVVTAR